MAIEEQIVAWSKTRPDWQRLVLRRAATGDALSDKDYDQLVEDIIAGKQFPEATFGLEHLPQAAPENPPVTLVSIARPEHVNALASDQPLTFAPTGMTIVYGDNGSGKSGYARLLKRITRARHQEEVLSDVFRDTSLAKPTALLAVKIGNKDESLTWPDTARPELQRMLFYDGACGNAYIAAESDFPYRPSALFVMDGLIQACVAVRSRIDAKLQENGQLAQGLPAVPEEVKETDAGRFLRRLSGSAPVESMDVLIKELDESSETIDDLKDREARLLSTDISKERQTLARQREKLDALHKHLVRVQVVLGDDSLRAIAELEGQLTILGEAANLLASSFESQPLPGVGSSPWKALWESAKRFSEEHAYPQEAFPVVEENRRCVLCQQTLEQQGRERLLRFDSFVNDDTQVRLGEARRTYDRHVAELTALVVVPDAVEGNLKDLESSNRDLVANVEELLERYEGARKQTLEALSSSAKIPKYGIEPMVTMDRLTAASEGASAAAEGLLNPDTIQQRLWELTGRRKERELLQEIKKSRGNIVKEIARLKEREALEAAKSAAATGPITNKILELSEESITEVVRDTFTRETDRLRLERVTISRTRADKGTLLHQPKLVGARQQVTLPRVFSEGERTALGLAAFFTEAHLDASKSALILDDPVTSLDHIRRGLVAARLAALAEVRQVVVFTHDVSFVADLKRDAIGKGVPIAERSVARNRADELKPGVCGMRHPWKAQDVPARLDELRQALARIKRESSTWDDQAYEGAVAVWAGNLSETWERVFSQEIVGPILAEGGLEVRPMNVKILARFSDNDHSEFDGSYSRVSQWAKRHDKSAKVNYVSPDIGDLEKELALVDTWFKRVKGYKNS